MWGAIAAALGRGGAVRAAAGAAENLPVRGPTVGPVTGKRAGREWARGLMSEARKARQGASGGGGSWLKRAAGAVKRAFTRSGSPPAPGKPDETPGAKGEGRDIDRLWAKQSRWDLMERAIGALSDVVVPTGVHGISVAVVGGPNADIRRCWYLALAAAFGRFRASAITAFYGLQVRAEWLVTDKAVSVTLVYATNINAGQIAGAVGSVAGDSIADKSLKALGTVVTAGQGLAVANGMAKLLQRGPVQYTEGGPWPKELLTPTQLIAQAQQNPPSASPWTAEDSGDKTKYRRFTGAPESDNVYREVQGGDDALAYSRTQFGSDMPNGDLTKLSDTAPPALPDQGRVITTGSKLDPVVQPPRPAVDGLSRGSLVQLVTAALGEAGEWPQRPGNLTPVLGSTGRTAAGSAQEASTGASVNRYTQSPDGEQLPAPTDTSVQRVTE